MTKTQKYIIVVGCGRLGSLLAADLSSRGHSVVVIDRSESAFSKLSSEFSGFTIAGDAAELSILRSAKIDRADCLLAVTNRDNINLMVAQIGKKMFRVAQTIARVFDPSREKIYHDLGIDTISPTQLSAAAFMERFTNPPASNGEENN